MTNVAAERDAFEAWYAQRHPKPTHESSTRAHCAKMDDWEVWQARTGAAPAAVAPRGVVAWMTPEGDRVVTAETMDGARKDGGASLSSLRPYTVALIRGAVAPALEAPAAPTSAASNGWRLVPTGRATTAMVLAASHAHVLPGASYSDLWTAMLAAAPQAPAAPAEAQRLAQFLQRMRTHLGSCRESAGEYNQQAWDDYERAWTLLQGMAAPAAPAVDASDDKVLLDFLRDTSCDLRSIDVPTGGDDSDVHWRVIEHYMSEPREREIGRSWSDDPREAIRAAIAAQAKEGGA